MSDITSSYFNRLTISLQGTQEERDCAAVLFNDTMVSMGDARLNKIAALTYNNNTCQRIFSVIDKALNAQENPWKTIVKALYMLHTIVMYGSELAIDMAIKLCPFVSLLRTYNSALVKKGVFSFGGTDYGRPVREEAEVIYNILLHDKNIRQARAQARQGDIHAIHIPKGSNTSPAHSSSSSSSSASGSMAFGGGSQFATHSAMGAGFGLDHVPGMYEGRPERYFDNDDDVRRAPVVTGDHQFTREKMAPDLLDLVFDEPKPQNSGSKSGSGSSSTNVGSIFDLVERESSGSSGSGSGSGSSVSASATAINSGSGGGSGSGGYGMSGGDYSAQQQHHQQQQWNQQQQHQQQQQQQQQQWNQQQHWNQQQQYQQHQQQHWNPQQHQHQHQQSQQHQWNQQQQHLQQQQQQQQQQQPLTQSQAGMPVDPMEKQRELERLLAEQKAQLERLQSMQGGMGGMQPQYNQQQYPQQQQQYPQQQQQYPQHQQQYTQQQQQQRPPQQSYHQHQQGPPDIPSGAPPPIPQGVPPQVPPTNTNNNPDFLM